jgi:hypothetical protein
MMGYTVPGSAALMELKPFEKVPLEKAPQFAGLF